MAGGCGSLAWWLSSGQQLQPVVLRREGKAEKRMWILVLAFAIGVASGLRSLTGLAVISWAAHLHRLHLEDSALAFLGFAATPYILTLLALGELVNDKLPKTPSRTAPLGFGARLVTGALCGAAIGAAGQSFAGGLIAGFLGAAAGTLGGARVRGVMARAFGRDLPAALVEDVATIVIALVVVRCAGA